MENISLGKYDQAVVRYSAIILWLAGKCKHIVITSPCKRRGFCLKVHAADVQKYHLWRGMGVILAQYWRIPWSSGVVQISGPGPVFEHNRRMQLKEMNVYRAR